MMWQQWYLIAELVITAMIGLLIVTHGARTGVAWHIFWAVSDAVCVVLVAQLGPGSWQQWVLGILYGWGAALNMIRAMAGGKITAPTSDPETLVPAAFFCAVLVAGMIALVVTAP